MVVRNPAADGRVRRIKKKYVQRLVRGCSSLFVIRQSEVAMQRLWQTDDFRYHCLVLSSVQLEEAARCLLEARRARRRISALAGHCTPTTTAEAEAICEAMARGLEQPIGGWKVGCTDPGMPAKYGLERPFCGQIPAQLIYQSGVVIVHQDLMRAVIEPEIGFRLARDLPARQSGYSRDEVMDAIGALVPGVEIPESRLLDDHPHGALGMVADLGYAGRFVEGPSNTDWRHLDLPNRPVVVRRNGLEAARGAASRAMGNPVDAVVWLANYRCERGDGLRAGQIISTGTLTGIIPVSPGDEILADYGDLGSVSLRLT